LFCTACIRVASSREDGHASTGIHGFILTTTWIMISSCSSPMSVTHGCFVWGFLGSIKVRLTDDSIAESGKPGPEHPNFCWGDPAALPSGCEEPCRERILFFACVSCAAKGRLQTLPQFSIAGIG